MRVMSVIVDEQIRGGRRSTSWIALGVLVLVLGAAYYDSWKTLANTWLTDTTFSHGLLIIPLAVYLAWTKRAELARLPFSPSWVGVVLLVGALSVWLFGRLVHLRVLEHIGLVGALISFVPLVLGTAASRALMFPLGFVCFALPLGKELVPPLMEITADLSVFFLRITGVPVYREGMLLHIPAGTYEVARACSGIKFLTAAVALGAFYAYLNYRSMRKRLIFVGAAIVVAILSNGLRAYLLVLIGHLTDMTFRHDRWHIVLGYVVFGVALLLLFYAGSRYRDDDSAPVSEAAPPVAFGTRAAQRAPAGQLPLLGLLLLAVTPALARVLLASGGSNENIAVMAAPVVPLDEWVARDAAGVAWRPQISGGIARVEGSYGRGEGTVDVFIEVYPVPSADGAEMISYRNSIQADANERLYPDRVIAAGVDGLTDLQVRETRVPGPPARLVWYWYDVAGEIEISPTRAKLAEALTLLKQGRAAQRVVVLSTVEDTTDAARDRLRGFLAAHQAQLLVRTP
jgi:exosortase A